MEQSYDLLSMRLRNNKWFLYGTVAAFALGLAMLIAGGVMLGIGIHKHNQKVEAASCPAPLVESSSTSTTIKPTTVKSVLILLDTSSDISESDFQTMKAYVALNVVPSLPINVPIQFRAVSNAANVALLSYSAEAVSIHNFYDVSDVITLQNQIDNIPRSQAGPSVSKAVLTTNQLFPSESLPNVMMVMGSGNQADLDKAASGVASLGSVAWVALGGASQLNFTKINSSTTVSVYTSRFYELSDDQTKKLLGQLNPSNISPPPPTQPTLTPLACNNDVVILIDASGATGSAIAFFAQLDFLVQTINASWTVGRNNVEALAISYSELTAQTLTGNPFYYNSTTELINDIKNNPGSAPDMSIRPSITGGFNYVQSHLTDRRPNANLSTLLVTFSSDYFDISTAVPEALNIGGQLVVLGVGAGITRDNLYYLSGTVLTSSTLFEGDIGNQINSAICAAPIPASPLPSTVTPPTSSSSSSPLTSATSVLPPSTTIPTVPTTTPMTLPPTTMTTPSPSSSPTTSISSSPTTIISSSTPISASSSTSPSPSTSATSVPPPSTTIPTVPTTTPMTLPPTTTTTPSPSSSPTTPISSSPTTIISSSTAISASSSTSPSPPTSATSVPPPSTTIPTVPTTTPMTLPPTTTTTPSPSSSPTTPISSSPTTIISSSTAISASSSTSPSPPTSATSVPPPSTTIPTISTTTPMTLPPKTTTTPPSTPIRTTTTPMPTSVPSSTITLPTTTMNPTTTSMSSTAQTGPTTAPIPAYVCRSYIPFSFDVSTKLTSEEFRSLKNFLLNPFLHSVFPFDIQPAPFSTYGEVNYGVRRQANVTNIINYVTVDAIQQTIPDSYITAPLGYFVSQNVVSLGSADGLPVNTIIFAGDELASSFVADVQNYTNQLTANGNKLIVVLVDPNIDQTNYKKISGLNIVLWSDTSTLISNIEKNMKCPGATRPTNQPTTPSTNPSTTPSTVSTTQKTAASPSSTIVSSMSSNPTMATTTATNYLPCKSWISFSADNSMKLSAVNFQTQLSFISNAIGLINHPERLQFATLTDTTVPWQNSYSIQGIQNQINQTTQILTLTFSLRNSLSTLYTAYQSIVPTLTPPIGAIVFISDTSNPENYDGALHFATRLRNAGVTLTFVLLGSNVNQTLVNFADNYLIWTDLTQPQPDNWNNFSLTAYACVRTSTVSSSAPPTTAMQSTSVPSSTITLPTTTMNPTTTSMSSTAQTGPTTASIPAYVCRSYIPFSFDVSTKLTSEEFRSLKNFLLNPFLHSVFSFDIQPAPFSTYGEVNYGVRRQANVTNIINYVTVDAIQQTIPDSYITAPLGYFVSQNVVSLGSTDGLPVNTIIFAGDELASSFVADVQNYTNQLTANGNKLIVVLVDPNIDQTNYKKISGLNIVTWNNTTTMILQIESLMNCLGVSPPTNPSTSMIPSSSTTSLPPTTTKNPSIYSPCMSNILFVEDMSLSNGEMERNSSISLTYKHVVQSFWNHYERIGLASYAANMTCVYPYGNFTDQNSFNAAITSLKPFEADNSMTSGLIMVEDNFLNPSFTQNTVFFTARTDPIDLVTAVDHANHVAAKGKLIIIAINPGANVSAFDSWAGENIVAFEFTPLATISYDTIAQKIRDSFVCQPNTTTVMPSTTIPSTQMSSTAMPSTTILSTTIETTTPITIETTTMPTNYLPCKSWISFSADNSATLSLKGFHAQLTFIANAIGVINHPERLQFTTLTDTPVPWQNSLSIHDIQNQIVGLTQILGLTFSLRESLAALFTAYQATVGITPPIGAIVFISDTSNPENYDGALHFATRLRNAGVTLTFVLLGSNVNQTLVNFADNYLIWTDLTQPQPDNWNNFSLTAYACVRTSTVSSSAPPTTAMQSTSVPSSTITLPTTTMNPTTTSMSSTAQTGPTTAPIPAYVCRSYIPFSFDVSTKLTSEEFRSLKNFLLNPFLHSVFPFDIQPAPFSTYGEVNYGVRRQANVTNIINYVTVDAIQQTIPDSYITAPLGYFVSQNVVSLGSADGLPVNTIIFAGDELASSFVADVQNYTNQLTANGNKLIVVLVDPNIDQTNYKKISGLNIVLWSDTSTLISNIEKNMKCPGATRPTNQPTTPSTNPSTTPSTVSTTQKTAASPSSTIVSSMSSNPTMATTTATNYLPCKSWISFSADNSMKLSAVNFQTQLSFISNAIGLINHPERLQFATLTDTTVPWQNSYSIQGIQNQINQTTQILTLTFSLRNSLSTLYTAYQSIVPTLTPPIGAIVFISDTSNPENYDGALHFATRLRNAGVTLTFVLLGSNVNQTLVNFADNYLIWTDLTQPQPDNWNNFSLTAYACVRTSTVSSSAPPTTAMQSTSVPSSTITLPTTTMNPTTTSMSSTAQTGPTTASIPAYVCRSYIPFSFDVSTKLTSEEFRSLKNFLLNPFLHSVFPFDIQPAPFSTYGEVNYGVRRQANVTNIINYVTVDAIQQTIPDSYITAPLGYFVSQNVVSLGSTDGLPVNTIIFAGDELASSFVADVQNYTNQLTANGNKLIVVLVDPNIDQTNYKKISGLNIVTWNDTTTMILQIESLMNCLGVSPPTNPSTATSTPMRSSQSLSTGAATTPNMNQNTTASASQIFTLPITTTPSQYLPCNTWISFTADNTQKLMPVHFQTQIKFISNAIGQINHPERLQYMSGSATTVSWRNFYSIEQIQNLIKLSTQITQSLNLREVLANLYTAYTATVPLPTPPIGAIVFVSDTSIPSNYDGAQEFSDKLKASGISLTLVLLGPNVDQNKLLNLTSNFINWNDLTQPQPDNWSNSSLSAYACSGATMPTTTMNPTTIRVSSTAQTGPTTAPIPAYVCRSYIPFSFDVSTKLTSEEFRSLKNFLLNSFLHSVFSFDIQPAPFSTYGEVNYGVRRQANVTNIINYVTVDAIQKTIPDSYITAPLGYFVSQNVVSLGSTDGLPINTIIFAGDKLDDSAVSDVQNYATQLTKNGNTLIVVLVNPNIDQTNYKNISGLKIVPWANTNSLIAQIQRYMNCLGGPSAPTNPTAAVTTATSTVSSATTNSSTITASTLTPVINSCLAYIPFSFDVSQRVTASKFSTLKNFLINQFLKVVFVSRLQPLFFSTYAEIVNTYRRPQNVSNIVTIVNETSQTTAVNSDVKLPLSNFVSENVVGLGSDGHFPVNTVIFAGSALQDTDVPVFQSYVTTLTSNGNKVIVVLLESTINRTSYQKITELNLVIWSDPVTTLSKIRENMNCRLM